MSELPEAIAAIVYDTFGVKTEIVLTRPDPQFGDFATNVALQLSKKLAKNPRDIAAELATKLQDQLADTVSEVTVAGPGFINLKLDDKVIIGQLKTASEVPQSLAGKVVVTEYSDPNPFKVLHAGHLYTTLVGDAVARLIEGAGAKVHRVNYGGDVGRHVGITMWSIIKHLGGEKPEALDNVPADQRLEWVSARYVEGTTAFEEDEDAKEEILVANKKVYDLHTNDDHDSNFAKIYWTCRTWSYDGFEELYKQLQVVPFERVLPESEVTPQGLAMVKKAMDKKILVESEGAVIFPGEEQGLHTRVFVNSKGLPTYEAKDLGLATQKWEDYHFDLNVIITANDIVEYMKVVLMVLSNFHPEVAKRTHHLTHGVIKLPGAVKMSSRKGNILRAVDILDAAKVAAQKIESNKVSSETVLGAVKYAFLKTRIGGDVIYDPDESVATEGNSGPYLQYAHARARSILVKSEKSANNIDDLDTAERTLAVKLTEFTEVITKATTELSPHLICTYLYELAQEFNRFYENNRVIDDPREAQRLYLVSQYAAVLKSGLNLLGIHAPEKM